MSQYEDALQVLLERIIEGLMSRAQLLELADRLAEDMTRTQDRNRRARESHRRRRLRELHACGIFISNLPCCDRQVAL